MRKIGVIGGMSCESSVLYYKLANKQVREKFGGLVSPKILINSVNFAEVREMQTSGDWDGAGRFLAEEALNLQKGGADIVLLATNTMHKVAHFIEDALDVPFLHIADAVAVKLKQAGVSTTGLLGTRYTMIDDFYKKRLKANHNIETVIPDEKYIDKIDSVIFDELCQGLVEDKSRELYKAALEDLKAKGAGAVILGCTEIGILIKQTDSLLKTVCSTQAHIDVALEYSLSDKSIEDVLGLNAEAVLKTA
tara:strand:+ start:3741 stop:4490 length:750 start_codon:yes stop_codon:yes gene_type:complete